MTNVIEGAAVPDFELETAEGSARLADFKDKTLVLYFYPKDNTPGCAREAQDFTALADQFARAGATVIGVSKDSLKAHKNFTTKYDLGVRLGSDPEAKVIEAWDSWVEKTLYGRKYMGIDRATFLIRDGRIAKIWRKVKVAGHAQAVLDIVQGG